jgi:ElaB/YqjD/DUF883 family membrane-anchored ribosome-binding protein
MQTRTGNGHGASMEKLMDDLRIVIQDGEELLKTGAGQLRDKAIAGARVTDERIRKNPYPSLGIVFGLGLLLGILTINLINSGAGEQQEEGF